MHFNISLSLSQINFLNYTNTYFKIKHWRKIPKYSMSTIFLLKQINPTITIFNLFWIIFSNTLMYAFNFPKVDFTSKALLLKYYMIKIQSLYIKKRVVKKTKEYQLQLLLLKILIAISRCDLCIYISLIKNSLLTYVFWYFIYYIYIPWYYVFWLYEYLDYISWFLFWARRIF